MFKRIEKRRIRKEENEELGELQETLGMETDSDESASESENSNASLDESTEGEDIGKEPDAEDSDDESEGIPTITVREALEDPIYVVSVEPDIRLCAICPGKLLKTTEMIAFHRKSDAHQRRWKTFKSSSNSHDPDTEVSTVLSSLPSIAGALPGMSNRAQKRKSRENVLMVKRKKAKLAKAAAKKTDHNNQETLKSQKTGGNGIEKTSKKKAASTSEFSKEDDELKDAPPRKKTKTQKHITESSPDAPQKKSEVQADEPKKADALKVSPKTDKNKRTLKSYNTGALKKNKAKPKP